MNKFKLFEAFCRQALIEWSTINHLIKDYPNGKHLMQHMHHAYRFPHDLEFTEVEKIRWREFGSQTSLAICIGKNNSAAAILYDSKKDSYRAIVSVDGEIKDYDSDRGGNVKDFIKSYVGKIKKIWIAREPLTHREKISKRKAAADHISGVEKIRPEQLLKRFSPLLRTSMEQVKADIKGMIANVVKGDAYHKAEKKIGKLKHLERALSNIEDDNMTDYHLTNILDNSIAYAIAMSAKHFYPDDTELERTYAGTIRAKTYYDRQNGVDKLLADIGAGDHKKVSSVLGFFKKGLLVL
jgi:hypothetical protein